jgi:hypothetical protein
VTAYRVDVTACREDTWAHNALTFETVEEATTYAYDLLGRWFGADRARVVTVDTADRETFDANDSRIVINYREGLS